MSKQSQLARVLDSCIVAVLRSSSGDMLGDVAEALLAGGVEVMEITFTVPRPTRSWSGWPTAWETRSSSGAGTVLDTETARTALLAGAEFIVAPTVNRKVIRLCRRYGKLVMPGALTPTEVLAAWEAGADIVKVFPSDFTGPGYLKALLGPLPQVRLMPTGGVNLQTAADYLRAGTAPWGSAGPWPIISRLPPRTSGRSSRRRGDYVELVRSVRGGR